MCVVPGLAKSMQAYTVTVPAVHACLLFLPAWYNDTDKCV